MCMYTTQTAESTLKLVSLKGGIDKVSYDQYLMPRKHEKVSGPPSEVFSKLLPFFRIEKHSIDFTKGCSFETSQPTLHKMSKIVPT